MAQLIAGTTINGSIAWHAGNDGVSSGLDADLVQGTDVIAKFHQTTGHSHNGTAGNGPKIGSGGLANDAVTDTIIGNRTATPTAPTTNGPGTLNSWLNWITERIKSVMGTTNWYDAVPTTLSAANTHIGASAPHSGHLTSGHVVGASNTTDATQNKHISDANFKSWTDHVGASAPHSGHMLTSHPINPVTAVGGTAVALGDTASNGSGTVVALSNHVHPNTGLMLTTHAANAITGWEPANPNALASAGNPGVSTKVARADHTHPNTGLMLTSHAANNITGFASANPLALGTVAIGTSTLVARADHVHPTTGLMTTSHGANSITGLYSITPYALADTGSAGTATNVARGDHIHPNTGLMTTSHPANEITGLADTIPNLLTTTGSAGIGTNVARVDHTHPTTNLMTTSHAANAITGFASAAPSALGTAAVGTSTLVAKADHVHPTTGLMLTSHVANNITALGGTSQALGTASNGSGTVVALANHIHPTTGLMLTTHAANSITGFGASGTATTVARSDHGHSAVDVGALPINGGTLTGEVIVSKDNPYYNVMRANGGVGQYGGIRVYDGASVKAYLNYDFTGNKWLLNDAPTGNSFAIIRDSGTTPRKIWVQADDPGANAADGDIWIKI